MSVRIPTFEEILAVSQSRGGMSYAPGLWNGLVGAWPLQEGGGATAFDASGYRRNGTLTNMDPATDWVVTEKGRALDFDGSNDFILTGTVAHNVGTGDFSLAAWVYPRTLTGWRTIWANESYRPAFYVSGSTTAVALYWASPAVFTSVLALNAWSHLAFVRTAGVISLYVNAVKDSTTVAKALSMPNATWQLGSSTAAGLEYLNGRLTSVLFHSRALSAAEITQLYADPWAMYRQRRRVFAAAAAAPPSGNRRRRFLMVGADT